MCGRAYETYTEEELEMRYQSKKPIKIPKVRPNYNMCPTHFSPIVLERDGTRTIELFRWGLVPSWARDVKSADKYSLINARSEDIELKRTYQRPFHEQRCIVPLTGFYEWKRPEKGPKKPFAIHLRDNSIMSVAGVWEKWLSKETGEEIDSFSIITTSANKFMSKVHNRMPVIFNKEAEEIWLDRNLKDSNVLKEMLVPCPDDWLEAREVSTLVNSPKNNSPEVLKPTMP